jgi:hypothetical protein
MYNASTVTSRQRRTECDYRTRLNRIMPERHSSSLTQTYHSRFHPTEGSQITNTPQSVTADNNPNSKRCLLPDKSPFEHNFLHDPGRQVSPDTTRYSTQYTALSDSVSPARVLQQTAAQGFYSLPNDGKYWAMARRMAARLS